ncbi:MAG: hypothetical protein J6Q61_00260 [Bacteroidales bacterium]|nr:hypothetical protein [Bacteroidales bacterium]
MQKIEELTELIPVHGFKLVNATTQLAEAKIDGKSAGLDSVITLEFLNDHHVKIDVDIIEGEIHVSEPYAVDAE